jgi:hypothetical protein
MPTPTSTRWPEMLRTWGCSPSKTLQNHMWEKRFYEYFWLILRTTVFINLSCLRMDESVDVQSSISKLTLVPSKSYENRIYYMPFDAPGKVLQHSIFGFSFLNRSSYPARCFKRRGQNFWSTLSMRLMISFLRIYSSIWLFCFNIKDGGA